MRLSSTSSDTDEDGNMLNTLFVLTSVILAWLRDYEVMHVEEFHQDG